MDMVQRIAVKALIVNDDGKILLLREAATYGEGTQPGRYQLPGGRVEVGEPYQVALDREILEETGLTVVVQYPLYVGEWSPVIKGKQNQIFGIFFVCKPLNNEIKLSDEHDDFRWIEPQMRSALDVMDPEDKVIDRYMAWQANPLSPVT